LSKVIFLDLDGTLTDAGPGIKNCFNYALERMGLPEIRTNNDWIVGPPLWDSFAKIGVADDHLDHAVDLYRERYRDIGYLENALYDGVLDQLSRLKNHSFTLCLATSKAEEYAVKITAHFGIDRYLDHQFGSELDGTRSAKTDLLKHGLNITNSSAQGAVMVGDRSFDILGAHANDMAALGVLYGYGNQDELKGAGADGLIQDSSELAHSLITFFE
jgi:phosphoglycolate phosphatase